MPVVGAVHNIKSRSGRAEQQVTASVVEHYVPPAMVFAKQEERCLIDAVRNPVVGDVVERPSQKNRGRAAWQPQAAC